MAWWIWVLLGVALLVVEMVTPGGLFALFFGIGALCVAALAAVGAGTFLQWFTFAALSLVLLGTLRRTLQRRLQGAEGPPIDSLVGQEVVLLQDLPAGGQAQAELRGVPWSVKAASGIPLPSGQRCKVERVDGVVLYVTAA